MSNPPLALIASNHEWVARSLDSILAPGGYSVLRTRSMKDTLRQAALVDADVYLVDAAFPDGSGAELCAMLQAQAPAATLAPVVIIAQGPVARNIRVEAFRAGAWDFFVFPGDAEEMLLRVGVCSRAKSAIDSARALSLIDPQTGCYSERGLLRRAHEMGAAADRAARAMACVSVAPDLAPEERPGAGTVVDQIIHDLGGILEAHTRDSDSVGRIGPMEFVVLAPDTDARGALRLAERLASAAEAMFAAHGIAPTKLRAGCFGVQNFRDAAVNAEEMITRSTLALRQAQNEAGAAPIQLFRSGGSAGPA